MSLYGTMNTAVSGMNAQANKISAVGDNIANADTTGYKRSNIQFSSLLLSQGGNNYASGSVNSIVRHDVSVAGNIQSTSSASDLAIQGNGFFVVQNQNGTNFLTRAGSFRMNDNGDLVNASGFALMGYNFDNGNPASQINGLTGLQHINLSGGMPRASATSRIEVGANLDSRKTVPTGPLPSSNQAGAQYTSKTSVTAYDPLGNEIKYDVYFTKMSNASSTTIPGVNGGPSTTTTTPAQWDVAIFRADKAATSGGFPYTDVPDNNTMMLEFDTNGKLNNTTPSLSLVDIAGAAPQTVNFSLSNFSQLATDFTPTQHTVDGSKAASIVNATIDKDGTVYAIYSDNTREPRFRIPLANVASPDKLTPEAGNVYSVSTDSGVTYTGFPGEGEFGTTLSNSLESSNVDMATELTDMIQAQRNYTANSKVFQTGSDLMDILVNLKR